MKGIARDLGVSTVTVSKALRNHPDISKTTRARILDRVKELGYRPNLTARSLVTGHSSLIGLIVPDLIHPFFADVAKGLSSAVRQRGYFLLISSSEEDPELEAQEIDHMLAHRLDALVIASCQTDPTALRNVQRGETPLILVDRSFKSFPSYFVGSDDYAAGKLATEHLVNVGCRRIAHIRGPENSVGIRRLKGFLDTIRRHGLAIPEENIIRAPRVDVDGKLNGAAALRQMMALPEMADGVFCYNDVIAMGVIKEALSQGINVPEDLAVIGCGNLHYDAEIRVPLSSIDQRSNQIGGRAAKLILEILGSETPMEFQDVILQPKLAARASTERTARSSSTPAKTGAQRRSAANV
ncbi:LacI family DNA-binding transcriptional regulator [Acidisarcina polymorpha]|nr:LacI family DNA-binding transcriptional regulator [Acidisarcina polymorpha]